MEARWATTSARLQPSQSEGAASSSSERESTVARSMAVSRASRDWSECRRAGLIMGSP
ncbi:hypothetical protein ACFFX0_20090 [Citricoccus parietis]|uniref:Uncharacterized protein n=1 Tax=Citricoccus parietis TaxID=592307 RepID=A0ABV5G358_9MICC